MGDLTLRFLAWFGLLLLSAAMAAVIAVVMVVKAHAEGPTCMPYGDLTKAIAEQFGESPAGSGITDAGKSVLMMFASPKGATWTAAMLGSDGNACIMAHGTDWENVILPQFSSKGRRPA